MWGGMSDISGGRVSPSMSDYFGQQTGPSIFQGMQWVNIYILVMLVCM